MIAHLRILVLDVNMLRDLPKAGKRKTTKALVRYVRASKVDSLLGTSIGFTNLPYFGTQKECVFERISQFVLQKKYFWVHSKMFFGFFYKSILLVSGN